jgi:hypothetical protein
MDLVLDRFTILNSTAVNKKTFNTFALIESHEERRFLW